MKRSMILAALVLLSTAFVGCMSTHMTMSQSYPEVQLKPENLEISAPVEATASTIRVFGIDWERLTSKRTATVRASVYSNIPLRDRTDQYAIYALLKQNEGYDMVMYPQFTTVVRKPVLGLGSIYKVTEVKVRARMAKLKDK